MMVNIQTDSPLVFGGTEEPAANGTLHSIGAIGGDKNKAITKAIQEIVTAKLGVPNDRFYLAVRPMTQTTFDYLSFPIAWPLQYFGIRMSGLSAMPGSAA